MRYTSWFTNVTHQFEGLVTYQSFKFLQNGPNQFITFEHVVGPFLQNGHSIYRLTDLTNQFWQMESLFKLVSVAFLRFLSQLANRSTQNGGDTHGNKAKKLPQKTTSILKYEITSIL